MKTLEKREFLGLEMLRFLCALTVLIFHYQHFFILSGSKWVEGIIPEQMPFWGIFELVYQNGDFAVRVFWLLSGFIFFWKYSLDVASKAISFKSFIVLRLSRLYPLHILTLIVVAVLQFIFHESQASYFIYEFNDLKHFALHVFFASAWGFQEGYSFNAPVWSVSIEILVYFTFFWLVSLLEIKSIGKLLVTVLLFFLLYKIRALNRSFLECGLLFFYGGLLFKAYEKFNSRIFKHLKTLSIVLTAVFFIVFLNVEFGTVDDKLISSFSKTGYLFVKFLIFPALIVLPFLIFFENKIPNRMARKLTWLGNLTYSSYMIHFPIQLIMVLTVSRLGFSREVFLLKETFFSFLIVTFLLSYLVFEFVEMPLQKICRKKFLQVSR